MTFLVTVNKLVHALLHILVNMEYKGINMPKSVHFMEETDLKGV